MNYRFVDNTIEKTSEAADGIVVFGDMQEAKREMILRLEQEVLTIRGQIRTVRALKERTMSIYQHQGQTDKQADPALWASHAPSREEAQADAAEKENAR